MHTKAKNEKSFIANEFKHKNFYSIRHVVAELPTKLKIYAKAKT